MSTYNFGEFSQTLGLKYIHNAKPVLNDIPVSPPLTFVKLITQKIALEVRHTITPFNRVILKIIKRALLRM